MENTENTGSTDNDNNTVDPALELKLLKDRARMMGIEFSNNISKEKLLERINAKMEGEAAPAPVPEVEPAMLNPFAQTTAVVTPKKKMSVRDYLIQEEMKLVRVRITNLDPKKKDLPGEILTIANGHLGTVRKFVPFGEVTDNGYHIPYCLYRLMDERRFLDVRTRKVQGKIVIEQRWAKEFALEVLPSLTPVELSKLATAQIAAGTAASPESA